MNKHFGKMPEFQKLAQVTTKSPVARKLRDSSLTSIRNQLVFHFEAKAIGGQLQDLELEKPIFIAGMGTTNAQVYYELSDLCTLMALSDVADGTPVEILIEQIGEVIGSFTDVGEAFMVAALTEYGWHSEPVSS